MSVKLVTWNVNGLRSVARHGFTDWFARVKADVVCVQEIKCHPSQLEGSLVNPSKYHAFWNPAEKAGYSGVAVFSRKEPLAVRYGLGSAEFDREGRVITVEFANNIVINSYFPNSQRDHARLDFKLAFCEAFARHCRKERRRGKSIFLCGDWNIAHTEIDLKNPKSNRNNAGFLPEERAWLSGFLSSGYVDCFREFTPDPGHYTWWSYRPGVRERNIGWRLDYFLCDRDARPRLRASKHHCDVMGSDHCPVLLQIQD